MAEPSIVKKRKPKSAPTYESSPNLRKRGSGTDPNQQTRQYSANTRVTPTPEADNPRPKMVNAPGGSGAGIGAGIGSTTTGTKRYTAPVTPGAGISAGVGNATVTGKEPESEELDGFAGDHFSHVDLPTVWENPWLIVNAALKERGNDTIPLKELMRQYGEFGLPIFTMLKGLTGDTTGLGSDDTINWISRWINSMSSKGGSVPTYEGLLGNVLQARGTDTILGEALNSGQATDQVNTLMTYLRAALGTNSLNPIASSAVLSQANREGDAFIEAGMGGQDGYTRNFTDWLNSGGHRLFGDPRL